MAPQIESNIIVIKRNEQWKFELRKIKRWFHYGRTLFSLHWYWNIFCFWFLVCLEYYSLVGNAFDGTISWWDWRLLIHTRLLHYLTAFLFYRFQCTQVLLSVDTVVEIVTCEVIVKVTTTETCEEIFDFIMSNIIRTFGLCRTESLIIKRISIYVLWYRIRSWTSVFILLSWVSIFRKFYTIKDNWLA